MKKKHFLLASASQTERSVCDAPAKEKCGEGILKKEIDECKRTNRTGFPRIYQCASQI